MLPQAGVRGLRAACWVGFGGQGVVLAACLPIPQTSRALVSRLFICLSACPYGLEKLAAHTSPSALCLL